MKHKILIVPLISILIFGKALAQEYTNLVPEWLVNSTGENWDVVCDMAIAPDSCFFIAGNYSGTSKIGDKTTALSGDNNSFIIKLDREGNPLWQTHLVSSGFSNIVALSVDGDGAAYSCGTFKGSLNVGSSSVSDSINKSLFILKLNKDGEVKMLQGFPGGFSNRNIALANNNKHELLLAAAFKGHLLIDDLDFTSNYYHDILIAKIGDNGKILNKSVLHGEMDDIIHDIACDGNNNIYLTGSFERDLSFNGQRIRAGDGSDAFLIKLDDAFEVVYEKQIGGIYDDYGKSIAIGNNGNVLLTGSFAGELPLTGTYKLTSNGVLDVFVVKYDKNGKLLWADSFGGGANDYVGSVAESQTGNIYIDGTYRGSIEKEDSRIKSSGFSNDVFLAKYKPTGKFQFLETAGDTTVDFGRKLLSDKNGYVYLSGDFNKSLTLLDKETQGARDNDFFIARLYDCEESPKVQLPADTTFCGDELKLYAGPGFEQYFWNGQTGPANFIVDTSGTYIVQALDRHSCVSRDTIMVNLSPIPAFDLGDTLFVLKGEHITLDAPAGMETYLWGDGSGLSFLDVNTAKLQAGLHTYSLKVIDENNCKDSDDIALVVLENPGFNGHHKLTGYTGQTPDPATNMDMKDMTVEVYPNPAKEKLNIYFNNVTISDEIKIELFSTNGDLIYNNELTTMDQTLNINIDIKSIPAGAIIIVIKINNITFTKRIVVL